MNIAFRVDSSYEIGTGHVMRCLTLADAFSSKLGANIYFFSRKAEGNINKLIEEKGFNLIRMRAPGAYANNAIKHSAWLGASQKDDASETRLAYQNACIDSLEFFVVDHYGIGKEWHQYTRGFAKRIFVIDDLADREFDCDYLLNQTYGCTQQKYEALVPDGCELFLGSNYALLRKEFLATRELAVQKRKNMTQPKNILITLGGVDKNNIATKVLHALEMSSNEFNIVLIAGNRNKHLSCLKKQSADSRNNIELKVFEKSMAQAMLNADLCIGAAGSTSWERCVLGLASVNIVLAPNQEEISRQLDLAGAARDFGYMSDDKVNELTDYVDMLCADKGAYAKMVHTAFQVCDGEGVDKVVQGIIQ